MKHGDKVTILIDPTEPDYEKTDAEVISMAASVNRNGLYEAFCILKRWDATSGSYFESDLMLTKDFYKTPIFDDISDFCSADLAIHEPDLPPIPEEVACIHESKYLNVISKTMKFYVCKNCGMDFDA